MPILVRLAAQALRPEVGSPLVPTRDTNGPKPACESMRRICSAESSCSAENWPTGMWDPSCASGRASSDNGCEKKRVDARCLLSMLYWLVATSNVFMVSAWAVIVSARFGTLHELCANAEASSSSSCLRLTSTVSGLRKDAELSGWLASHIGVQSRCDPHRHSFRKEKKKHASFAQLLTNRLKGIRTHARTTARFTF